jgi:hypothetical protein
LLSLSDSNFDDLLKFLGIVSKDMLETMTSCIAKEPSRKDIIREYIDYQHERICDIIREFWDKNHTAIESVNLLKLASWMNIYSSQLKDFFNDDRMLNGIKTLLGIYINRSIESVESVI